MNKITIYTKNNCCLCQKAKQVLLKIKKDMDFILEEKDISCDKKLLKKFAQEIPVVFLNNKKKFKFFIEENRLKRLLKNNF